MEPKYRILAVDDEYPALVLLEEYLRNIPDVELAGSVTSPVKALELIRREPVDILITDIQMPVLSGIHLIRTVKAPPAVIITTAYHDYAVEAFEIKVTDYLVKPFAFERFLVAIERAKEAVNLQKGATTAAPVAAPFQAAEPVYLTVKAGSKYQKLSQDEILFFESLGEYVRVVTLTEKLIIHDSLKNLEQTLPGDKFLRVHKSHIVALGKVSSIEGYEITVGPHHIIISREKKDKLMKMVFGL